MPPLLPHFIITLTPSPEISLFNLCIQLLPHCLTSPYPLTLRYFFQDKIGCQSSFILSISPPHSKLLLMRLSSHTRAPPSLDRFAFEPPSPYSISLSCSPHPASRVAPPTSLFPKRLGLMLRFIVTFLDALSVFFFVNLFSVRSNQAAVPWNIDHSFGQCWGARLNLGFRSIVQLYPFGSGKEGRRIPGDRC